MRVVVTGASGNVGTALLRCLATRPGAEVTAVARRPPPQDAPPYDTARWIACDVGAPGADGTLVEAMQGADAVVHLAWAVQPSHRPALLSRTNVHGSRQVFDAVRRTGVPQLVQLSSVGVYAPGPGEPDRRVDESWPPTGVLTSSYSRHKVAVEAMLDHLQGQAGGLTIARLRPALIFQRDAGAAVGRAFAGSLAPLAALRIGPPPLLPVPAGLRLQAIHAADVAEGIVAVLHRRAAGRFNLAAEPVLPAQRLAALLGSRAVLVDPAWLRAAALLTWKLRLQPTEPGWLDLALAAPLLDTGRARRELDWAPRRSAEEAFTELFSGLAAGSGTGSPALRPRGVYHPVRSAAEALGRVGAAGADAAAPGAAPDAAGRRAAGEGTPGEGPAGEGE